MAFVGLLLGVCGDGDGIPAFDPFTSIAIAGFLPHPSHPYLYAWWPSGHVLGYEHSFTHTVVDFVRALSPGERVRPDFEDGVRDQRALDGIERSPTTRAWQAV